MISDEFKKLKSEFELFKLCQRNQMTKTADDKKLGISSKSVKCNTCDSAFQTESGLKVHNDLVHNKEPVSKEKLICKHCTITCSDLDVMNKHIVREHKFKCQECNATFKEVPWIRDCKIMQYVVSMLSFGWRKKTSSTTNNGFVSFMLKGLQSIEVNEEYLIPNKKRKCLKDPPSCNTVY